MPVNSGSVGPGIGGTTSGGGGGSGTVTSVSVVTANGLAGTVATPTTTPAITLTTSVTGILKGNGTSISAATAGTDYLTPSSNIPSAYLTSTITADPNPGVAGTYYRANYAANGNFTLPAGTTAGQWIKVKQVANNTLSIVGTVDGNASFTLVQFQSYTFIANGTNWDIN